MEVQLGGRPVGDGHPCYVLAEIGINHNGDPQVAQKLIDVAAFAGCEGVKFQKRTIDVVYTPDELAKPRESPFGETNGELKRGLEFGQAEYEQIDAYCRSKGIAWTASGWDEASVDFIDQFDPPFYKIASASLTDDALLRHTRAKGKPVVLSTGMSTLDQIDHAVEVLGQGGSRPPPLLQLLPVAVHGIESAGHPGASRALWRPGRVLRSRDWNPVHRRRGRVGRLSSSSDTSRSTDRSGGRIRLRRSNRTGSCAWCVTFGSSRRLMGDGVKTVLPSEIAVMQKLRRVGL